jgi:flagellar hook assembly protein FlgD
VLVDKEQGAGTYRILWDGKDSGGNLVASGVYLYSIHAGSFAQIKKMVLLR